MPPIQRDPRALDLQRGYMVICAHTLCLIPLPPLSTCGCCEGARTVRGLRCLSPACYRFRV